MPLLLSPDPRPVHFVGVAGAGMSALAELFVRRGAAVTGCDAHPEAPYASFPGLLQSYADVLHTLKRPAEAARVEERVRALASARP